jgi:hypothetical protein
MPIIAKDQGICLVAVADGMGGDERMIAVGEVDGMAEPEASSPEGNKGSWVRQTVNFIVEP